MTARQARRERREAARKEAKRARKAVNVGFVSQDAPITPTEPTPPLAAPQGATREPYPTTPSRAEINRANAQFSTGPSSPNGKLASSRNSLKHGLASGAIIIPGEDPAAFEALRNDLIEEHRPSSPTEELLIQEMAQAWWLAQRAICLQSGCFTENGIDEKRLSLFLRYQTTQDRRFHKALTELLKLKKQQRAGFVSQNELPAHIDSGFVSQKGPTPATGTEFVWQNAAFEPLADGFVSQKGPTPATGTEFVWQNAAFEPLADGFVSQNAA